MQLALSLLGRMEVTWAGQPASFATTVARALLAYLALESDRPQPRELLAGLLWPDQPQTAAFNNFRQTLSRLRKALPDPAARAVLTITPQTIQFNRAAAAIDVARFEEFLAECAGHAHADLATCAACRARLAQAAELYRGEFLHGLFLEHSQPFEEWLLFKREELHQKALEVLYTLTRAHEAAADYGQMRRYAGRQLALEPWREEAHVHMMRALAHTGQRAAALLQYETCRRILEAELRMAPAPETTELYEQIRAHEPLSSTRPASSSGLQRAGRASHDPAWSGAPETGPLHGRQAEQTQLKRWLVRDRCRLVAVLGMGGVGKTALAATVVNAVADHFDRVIWRSLLNAPPFEELLRRVLQALAGQPVSFLPASLDDQLALLLDELRTHRYLLVLDNLESLLHADGHGQMRPGYEGYAHLLQQLAHSQHSSCLILTSRERPHGMARWEADLAWVRALRLEGLDAATGQAILAARGLRGQAADAHALTERYSGHPLALKLVAQTVHEFFGGQIAAFLREETPIFDDIRTLLDQQFGRLSELEQELLFWLAIEREPISAATLRSNLVQPAPLGTFLEALRALQRRSLLERVDDGVMLQNVVIEYLTERLVDGVCAVLLPADQATGRPPGDQDRGALPIVQSLLNRFALIKAQAKEYIRHSQMRMIVQPIAERLVAQLGTAAVAARVHVMLAQLRATAPLAPGYAGGNLLNLLLHLGIDVAGYDFSGLNVWQADLQGHVSVGVNFGAADLTGSAFTLLVYPFAVLCGPAGQVLVAGSSGNDLCLWQAAHGQLQLTSRTPSQGAYPLVFSPDGRLLAGGCLDHTFRLWSVATGATLHILQGHTGFAVSVAFSHDARLLASSSSDGTIRLWDVQSGRCLQTLRHPAVRHSRLAFRPAPNGGGHGNTPLLASGGDEQTICLWDTARGQVIDILRGHDRDIECLAFSGDGTLLASGSQDGTILLWDVRGSGRGRLLKSLAGHSHTVRDLVFHPNSQLLASGSADCTVRLWDVRSGQPQQILLGRSSEITRLAFNSDGRVLASVSVDRTVRLWEVQTGRALDSLTGYSDAVLAVRFRPDGRQLATGGGDGRIHLWDSSQGRLAGALHGHAGNVIAVAYSPDGRLLASGSTDATIHLWDLATGRSIRTLRGHTGPVKALAFRPDGRLLASGGADRTIRFWPVTTGAVGGDAEGRVLHGHAEDIETVAFSPDGCLLVSSSLDHTARLWRVEGGEEIQVLTGHTAPLAAAAFSPRGDRVATISYDDSLRLWEVATGRCSVGWDAISAGGRVVAFSPRGDWLAHSSDQVALVLREVGTGTVLQTLRGHRGLIVGLDWSPTAAILASSAWDGTVRLWDVHTGTCVQTLQPPGPYAGMNITGVTGITATQKAALVALGAVEDMTDPQAPVPPVRSLVIRPHSGVRR